MEQDYIKQKVNDWYHEYSDDLYKYVFFMIGDHYQTKDILQDTFLRAFNSFESFQGTGEKSWLFRIARNLTIDYIRKKKPVAYIMEAFPQIQTSEKTPEQLALFNETEKELYVGLRRIKRSYRDVIVLRKIRGFTISETSQILGWTENKVKVNLYRGLKALKHQLEKGGYFHESI
ncbi:MAG: RNA polymerase sigma factor [Bacillus sp. (in: Bacteria)]|nr:RNA polymerase sigma factor [Bacillus sp. (in: firmicutes)]